MTTLFQYLVYNFDGRGREKNASIDSFFTIVLYDRLTFTAAKISDLRHEVLTAALLRIQVIWASKKYDGPNSSSRFAGW